MKELPIIDSMIGCSMTIEPWPIAAFNRSRQCSRNIFRNYCHLLLLEKRNKEYPQRYSAASKTSTHYESKCSKASLESNEYLARCAFPQIAAPTRRNKRQGTVVRSPPLEAKRRTTNPCVKLREKTFSVSLVRLLDSPWLLDPHDLTPRYHCFGGK